MANGKTAATAKPKGKPANKGGKPKAKAELVDLGAGREILYPKVDAQVFTVENGQPITQDMAITLLGAETEIAYAQRMIKERPGTTLANHAFGKKDDKTGKMIDLTFTDLHNRKVRCWNNTTNRPFREGTAKKYAQDILNRMWADARNGEGRTTNGEAIIIGRTGLVLSGQHRLIGLILACQDWASEKRKSIWAKNWPEEPSIESVVTFGVDESEWTTRTLDNVDPRKDSDVIYTSPIFAGLTNKEKEECSTMLSKAVDLLWSRVKKHKGTAEEMAFDRMKYQTTGATMQWLDLHPKLKECVLHLWRLNQPSSPTDGLKHLPRAFSQDSVGYRLPPGVAAGLMYLMAACRSDGDAYRQMDPDPAETGIDFAEWDMAEEFWKDLSQGFDGDMKDVRLAFTQLREDHADEPKLSEKTAILTRAWNQHVDGFPVTLENVMLKDEQHPEPIDYLLKHGESGDIIKRTLSFTEDFGGIDLGPEVPKDTGSEEGTPPTPEEVEENTEEVRRQSAAEHQAKIDLSKALEVEAERLAKNGPDWKPLANVPFQPTHTNGEDGGDGSEMTGDPGPVDPTDEELAAMTAPAHSATESNGEPEEPTVEGEWSEADEQPDDDEPDEPGPTTSSGVASSYTPEQLAAAKARLAANQPKVPQTTAPVHSAPVKRKP